MIVDLPINLKPTF